MATFLELMLVFGLVINTVSFGLFVYIFFKLYVLEKLILLNASKGDPTIQTPYGNVPIADFIKDTKNNETKNNGQQDYIG